MSKSRKRSVFTFLRRTFLGLATLLLLLFVLLHTPFAQDRIAVEISRLLSQNGMTVELKGLGGLWPFRLRLEQVTVDDGDGVWLKAQDLSLNWTLRTKRILVHKLSIDRLEVFERPAFPESPEKSGPAKNPLEDFGWDVDLSNVSVNALSLKTEANGKEIKGALQIGVLLSAHEQVHLKQFLFTNPELSLNLRGKYDLADRSARINLDAERSADGQKQKGEIGLRFLPAEAGWKLTVNPFSVVAPPLLVKTPEPIELTKIGDAVELSSTSILLNEIPLYLEGKGTPEEIDFSLRVSDFDAGTLPEFSGLSFNGNLTGGIRIRGDWKHPVAEWVLSFKDLLLQMEKVDTNLNLSGQVKGSWSEAGLDIKGQLEDNDQNRLEAQLSSPETWSLQPLKIPDPDADFAARLQGTFNLSLLNRFDWMSNQRISGQLKPDVEVTKIRGTKHVNGSIILDQGVYDHYGLGTHVDQIMAEITLRDQHIEIISARAQTPGKGTLSANGNWQLKEIPGTGSLHLDLNNARVLHLDPVQAGLSGKISLTRNPGEKLAVDGKLVLGETTFHMDRLPKPIPKPVAFKVKGEPVAPPEVTEPPVTAKPKRGPNMKGDIQLSIPSSLLVQGKNIQSTWEGDFKISLSEGGWYLNGKLTPRRGTFNFFGRAFRLNKGTVHFNDVLGSSPILDLEAEYSRDGLDAVLLITGRADDPKFRLRSNPPLPDDEILSRILFGKELSTITGLQALEVGLALKSMMDSGGKSNFDLMGKARDLLGVDQLELRESGDAQGSAEIVAGRQINSRLYLEFNQSLKEPGRSIMLEYEIRRNLSISTETGTHILPGIGVNWKRDY